MTAVTVSWLAILEHWPLVVSDLAAIFHVDLTAPDAPHRSWLGVRLHILALLNEPASRLRHALGGD